MLLQASFVRASKSSWISFIRGLCKQQPRHVIDLL